MVEFWGKSGAEEKRESSEAVARPFEGRCMTYGAEFCGKTEEGDDLDRFADLVSLVALVRLVELGGRRGGQTELREDGATEGRNYGGTELGGRNYGEGGLGRRNYGEGETG